MTVPRSVSKKIAIMAAGGVLVLAVTAWGVSSHYTKSSAKPAPVDPDKLWEEMNKPGITDKEREEIGHKMHEAREAEMGARLDEYFKASDDQKVALLDKQIEEFEKRRQEWEQRRQQEEARRNQAGERNDGPTSRPFHDWRTNNSTPEERKNRSESRSPDEMGRRMAYFRALRERMAARGMEMPRGPGRGGHGPGGGRGGWGGGHGH